MSAEMRPYIVRQGDYLEKLAFVHGFDAEKVWNDAKNDELRTRRPYGHILAPGDIIYVPVKVNNGLKIKKGVTNRYSAAVPKVRVTIVLRIGGEVVASEPYCIEGLPLQEEGTIGADGAITFDIPVNIREVHIVLYEKNLAYPVLMGNLDPIEEHSGIRMRLAHLGYYGWYPINLQLDEEEDRIAIAAFQSASGLAPTGAMNDATRSALRLAHGS